MNVEQVAEADNPVIGRDTARRMIMIVPLETLAAGTIHDDIAARARAEERGMRTEVERLVQPRGGMSGREDDVDRAG